MGLTETFDTDKKIVTIVAGAAAIAAVVSFSIERTARIRERAELTRCVADGKKMEQTMTREELDALCHSQTTKNEVRECLEFLGICDKE